MSLGHHQEQSSSSFFSLPVVGQNVVLSVADTKCRTQIQHPGIYCRDTISIKTASQD